MNGKIKILIIGSGGREHAIGWKVKQSHKCGEIFFAPGNAGTEILGTNVDIKATDIEGLLSFAMKESIDLTLALPDDPLALGVVDLFEEHGLKIFGPNKSAAQLESSKAFAKRFMERNNLPTANFRVFTDFHEADSYLSAQDRPQVVKASGLALGKGVFICQTYKEARDAAENILEKKIFGESGREIVVEDFITGPEVSIHAFSDGKNHSIFPPAQDHKRVGEGDIGPNTGGMGTVAPLPFITTDELLKIEASIVAPTLVSMAHENMPFKGILYPGLMLTSGGPKILEYNARFGDPETQTYMRLLDTDIIDIFLACIEGKLAQLEIKWKPGFACTIVLASGGYPNSYVKGKIISGIDNAQKDSNIIVFHAGTIARGGDLVTNGGRVLGVSACGNTLEEALERAYEAVNEISFEGMQYRRDIGQKTLLLEK